MSDPNPRARTRVHPPHGAVIACETGGGGFALDLMAGPHRLQADEPKAAGGEDTGPSPYELLGAALAACTAMTLRMYAGHKGWTVGEISVVVRHDKVHAEDCADCESGRGRIDRFERVIEIAGGLDEDKRDRLLDIADKCPVHRTLHGEVLVTTRLAGKAG